MSTSDVIAKASDASLPEIGQHLGGFHHSTVLHNVIRVGKDQRLLAEGAQLVCQIMAPGPGKEMSIAVPLIAEPQLEYRP